MTGKPKSTTIITTVLGVTGMAAAALLLRKSVKQSGKKRALIVDALVIRPGEPRNLNELVNRQLKLK